MSKRFVAVRGAMMSWLLVPALLAACDLSSAEPDEEPGVMEIVGPGGGTVRSADGVLALEFPEGALAEATEIRIRATDDAPPSIGVAYQVGPEMPLGAPVVVSYRYDNALLAGRDLAAVTLARDVGGAWELFEARDLDEDSRTITVEDAALSFHYGVMEGLDGPGTGGDDDDDDDDDDDAPGDDDDDDDAPGDDDDDDDDDDDAPGDDDDDDDDAAAECGDGSPAAGELCFGAGAALVVGGAASAVVTFDADDDGAVDIAAAVGSDALVMLGVGDGQLAAAVPFAIGGASAQLAAEDVDGDDVIDLVSVGGADLTVLPGLGDGTFAAESLTIATGAAANSVVFADVDDDGWRDAMVSQDGGGTATLLLGSAEGLGLEPVTYDLTPGATSLRLADLNGDGGLDAVAGGTAGVGSIFGGGNGLFGPPSTVQLGVSITEVVPGDFNEDGMVDLAVAGGPNPTVMLLPGDGIGGYGGAVPLLAVVQLGDLAATDIDRDGHLDLLVTDAGADALAVLRGDGKGAFEAADPLATGLGPASLVIADLDTDGADDVIVADAGADTLTVFLADP